MACEFSERDLELRAQILDIIATNDIMLMTIYPNVIGVGLGQKYMNGEPTGLPTLSFLVSKKIPECDLSSSDMIPQVFDGVITDVFEVGIVVPGPETTMKCKCENTCKPSCRYPNNCRPSCKCPNSCNNNFKNKCKNNCNSNGNNNGDDGSNFAGYNKKYRPADGGVGIGRVNVGKVGTLGIAVRDNQSIYILSNNHVIAENVGPIGLPIIQPSQVYGGTLADEIAQLYKFVPIKYINPMTMPVNKVDAAIAIVGPLSQQHTIAATLVAPALHNGPTITGTYYPDFRDKVFKIGADSELTSGQVLFESVSITIPYGPGQIAYFTGQTSTTKMSNPGDSGSIGFDGQHNAFGLNFASSPTVSVYSPINEVLTAFNITFWNL